MSIFKEVAEKKYKLAVWSMALGIMAACITFFMPGIFSLVLGVLALIFALVAKKDYYTLESSTMSTIGLITGIYAVAVPVLVVLAVVVVAVIALFLGFVAALPDIIRLLGSL